MPKVYVVQSQHKWDKATGTLVPAYDFTPAEEYGEIVYLLKPNAAPFNSAPVIQELTEKLVEMNPEDFLLLTGNPALIGFACALAADFLGRKDAPLKMLQWHGRDRSYVPITADIWPA